MNTTITKYLLQAVLAGAAFLLSPLATAHASSVCNAGPIRSLPAGGGWGDESRCSCGSGSIQGGLFASNTSSAWLWSAGSGQVWVQIELQPVQGGSASASLVWAEAAAGGFYFVNGGLGRNDAMKTSFLDMNWTGRYRSLCVR